MRKPSCRAGRCRVELGRVSRASGTRRAAFRILTREVRRRQMPTSPWVRRTEQLSWPQGTPPRISRQNLEQRSAPTSNRQRVPYATGVAQCGQWFRISGRYWRRTQSAATGHWPVTSHQSPVTKETSASGRANGFFMCQASVIMSRQKFVRSTVSAVLLLNESAGRRLGIWVWVRKSTCFSSHVSSGIQSTSSRSYPMRIGVLACHGSS